MVFSTKSADLVVMCQNRIRILDPDDAIKTTVCNSMLFINNGMHAFPGHRSDTFPLCNT